MRVLISIFTALLITQPSFALDSLFNSLQEESLRAMAAAHAAEVNREVEAQKAKVERLRKDLEIAKGQGAQRWFKRASQICGGVATITAILVVASTTEKYGKYFGQSGDERAGMAVIGVPIVGLTGVCSGLTGILYAWTNDDVEALDALVTAARYELRSMQANKN